MMGGVLMPSSAPPCAALAGGQESMVRVATVLPRP